MNSRTRHFKFVFAIWAGLGFLGCRSGSDLPIVGSDVYQEVISLHHSAIARLQAGEEPGAIDRLTQLSELAPGEPSALYNLSVMALRRNDVELADQHLTEARLLAPGNGQISFLSGLLELRRERLDEAVSFFRTALDANPSDLKVLYALFLQARQGDGPDDDAEATALIEQILDIQPNNTLALLEAALAAISTNDRNRLVEAVGALGQIEEKWDRATRDEFEILKTELSDSDYDAVETQLMRLNNMLKRDPEFLDYLDDLATPQEAVAEIMTRLLRLPMPSYAATAADSTLDFLPRTDSSGDRWNWTGIFYPNGEDPPVVVAADGSRVRAGSRSEFAFPGGPDRTPPLQHGLAALDYDYDFNVDLAVVGDGGFRLFRQGENGAFIDATDATGLPRGLTSRAYTGVWSIDLDAEGDMDLVLASGSGLVKFINNGDGTFSGLPLLENVRVRDVKWADMDSDGDSDLTILDSTGNVRYYRNERAGSFSLTPRFDDIGSALSISVADMDFDGSFDLVALRDDGALVRSVAVGPNASLALERIGDAAAAQWLSEDLPQSERAHSGQPAASERREIDLGEPGESRLIVADLDNNGGLDVVVSTPIGTGVWLRQEDDFWKQSDVSQRWVNDKVRVFDVGDQNGDGLLDMIGLTGEGDRVELENTATGGYNFSTIRPRSVSALGDRRINTYGIGGEIEVKSGSIFQKQQIDRPVVHFGLGERTIVDAARIVWPNGDTQGEFDFESSITVQARQQLKGSCPWLFAFDGEGMTFVTDFLWRSPLGLRINALETAGIMTTEDWVKIRGDQLAERDGQYEVRITAELWETHFFDHVSLIAVDHPIDSEVFVDERFAFPPPELKIHETGKLHSVAAARDHNGRDVSDVVARIDGTYLGGFELASHQGRTEDHFVEIDLGSFPRNVPLWLIASGWVYPTDSSINVALGQGEFAPPSGVQLEVLGSDGKWKPTGPNLGFPAGKMKTMLIDLSGVFDGVDSGRLRLRTNLEIYWDAIMWTEGRGDEARIEHRISASTVELRYRGFSETELPDRIHPQVPIYNKLESTGQRWRDLVGYHTRFGDVRELVDGVDDRYVIMNAGDEMILRFPSPGPVPNGYVRDFVLVGDGWVKDGDYNTGFSTTVRPLPDHNEVEYTTAPGLLEEDPIYRRFPEDWETYHTRYVTPRRFSRTLQ